MDMQGCHEKSKRTSHTYHNGGHMIVTMKATAEKSATFLLYISVPNLTLYELEHCCKIVSLAMTSVHQLH